MTDVKHTAGDDDLSWFMVAVTRKRDTVILDYSEGWKQFDIDFYWEDVFETSPPEHLLPGAYLWTDFNIGWWGEDEAINASGGTFTPHDPTALRVQLDALLEAAEALLDHEIAHVGPYAGQRVIALRAAIAAAKANKQ